jgi:hypothetical protein
MIRLLRYGLMIVGACLLILSGLLMVLRRQEAQPPWMIYISDRDGNFEIYRARTNGSQPENLTHHPAHDIFLGWGPEGKWLAFASERFQGSSSLYRMSPYGTDIRAFDESQYPGQFGLGNIASHSPPIDLPLHAGLMMLIGTALLGVSFAPRIRHVS